MKSQHVAILALVGVAILLPILFCGLLAMNFVVVAKRDSKSEYTTVAEKPKSPKKVTLHSDDGEEWVYLLKSRRAYDKWRESEKAEYNAGFSELVEKDELIYVMNDTQAVIIKDFDDLTMVRIVDGKRKGKVGFVKTSWIKD